MPHYSALTKLGLPITIGQIGTIILGFADTLMIGHHSTKELAAAAFVNTLFTLVLIFAMGFSYGLTPLVGSHYGRDEHARIGAWLKNSVFVNMLLALLLMGIMTIVFALLPYMGQPEELIPVMRPYFLISLAGLPFVVLFNTFKQMSDGIMRTQTAMWILLGGNILNIIGNYLLIYGHGGMPEWGLAGAGVSTLFSRIVMAAVFVLLLFKGKSYRIYHRGFAQSRINKNDVLTLNKLGWPLGLQMGMETAAFSLSAVMVGWIGTTALAAHQIMLTLSQLFYLIYYGMASAVAIRVSYFHGQHDDLQVRRISAAGFHLILLIAVMLSIPVWLLRFELGSWFTDNAEVSQLAAWVVIPLIIYQFGDGLQCTYANALRGVSVVKPLMYVAFFAYFVVSLPLGYVFGFVLNGGLVGIWSAFPFGLTVAGVLYYYYFIKALKKR